MPPELLGRHSCAFSHRLEFRPTYLGMTDSRSDAAVGPGHDILTAHDLGVAHQAISDGLRMFDEVAVMSHDSRNQYLSVRQLDVFPDAPFMFMAGIRRFDGIGASADFENDIHDVFERDIVFVRSVITTQHM